MGPAQQALLRAGGHRNPRNRSPTALAHFNSPCELGGARRILRESARTTLTRHGAGRWVGGSRQQFSDRVNLTEALELTSRTLNRPLAEAPKRLERSFDDQPNRVDCARPPNRISVGPDIPPLGPMLVLRQPKVQAEYTEATSSRGVFPGEPGSGTTEG